MRANARSMTLQGFSHSARDAKSWPFEQARLLLDRILRVRLTDGERDLASSLISQGKADEAVRTFEAYKGQSCLKQGMAHQVCRILAPSERLRGRPWCAWRSGV